MEPHDPPHRAPLRVDSQGRPYFLWDLDMSLDSFRAGLSGDDADVRAYLIGKLLRQARPEDVAHFLSDDEIRANWPLAVRHVGHARGYWQARLQLDDAAPTPP